VSQVKTSACPLNCWDACGFQVTIENNKVIKIDGNPNHPITQGKICGRGRMLKDRTNAEERILYPLKRINGRLERISWNQALDEIAGKMRHLKETVGTTAVMHSHDYSNSGLLKNLDQRFFNCYGGITEVTGSLCWGAGIAAQLFDFGNAYSHAPEDIYNSRHIVIWGRNVVRTNMHLFSYLKEAKKQGISLCVIDPIHNATAKIADQYIPIKPGMDGVLALGIMKEILRLGLESSTFIHNYSQGFEDLEELLDTITVDEVVDKTGVSRGTIEQLANIYGNGPTTTFLGLGMQRYANGGNTIRTIDALTAMSGNVGIPGGGVNYANLGVGESFDISALALPERKKTIRTFTRMNQAEQILSAKHPEVKMLFVTRSNPLAQVPHTSKIKKAFESIETKIVIDQFLTDTAELADYVLPCTTVFEEEDIYYASMYHHFINYGAKLVSPRGEAKPDLEIWRELANRLGFGVDFNYSKEEFLKMGLGKLEETISLEKLKEIGQFKLPLPPVPWADFTFQTLSGKYEFTSLRAKEEGLDGRIKLLFPLESTEQSPVLAKKYPYTLLSIHPLRSNHSQHYHLIGAMQAVIVEVSSDIAKEKQLKDGDNVRLFNNRGELRGTVKVLKEAAHGVINVDEGQWQKFGGSVNHLTPNGESDIGVGSVLYDCLVNIEKIS
jgi:anaerobic selenocysteine-containing dehydrogenase